MKTRDEVIDAIIEEINLRHHELDESTLTSIYFGGGTPSVLTQKELNRMMEALSQYYHFENAEITLEANPDDLTLNQLDTFKAIGINRLSIGIQSFHDIDLQAMNRAHNATMAKDCLKMAMDVGFDNISADLIYGSPSTTDKMFRENIATLINYGISHISAYALTVEPNTALAHFVKLGKVEAPSDEHALNQFSILRESLKLHGYNHYEISNFGKPGFHSRHNANYWKGRPYLGIGPSAHSYDGKKTRSWNIAHNVKYTQSISKGILPLEREILSLEDRFNEAIMLGLRTQSGLSITRLNDISIKYAKAISPMIQQKIKQGILESKHPNFVHVSEKYLFQTDGIASDLFIA